MRNSNMVKRYQHTQVGYVTIVTMTAALVLIGVALANAGMNWIAVTVMIVIGVALVLFSSLTVVIRDDELEVRFGPGPFRKKFKLREIESCRRVKNPWYYGWGIRLIPHGLLYNVSGVHAVEIKMKNGRQYRIGTNAAGELEEAILRTIRGVSR